MSLPSLFVLSRLIQNEMRGENPSETDIKSIFPSKKSERITSLVPPPWFVHTRYTVGEFYLYDGCHTSRIV